VTKLYPILGWYGKEIKSKMQRDWLSLIPMKSRGGKIKILYEIHPFIVGGTEKFLYHLLKHIDRKRFEPIAISRRSGKPLSLLSSLGIAKEVVPMKHEEPASQKLLKIIKYYKPQIIQSNYYRGWLAVASYIANIPHVWNIEGHIDVALSRLNQQEKRECLNTIDHFSYRIVCPSNFVQKQFVPILKNGSKVNVIYHGTAIPNEKNNDQKKKYLNDHFSVGMIGHFSPQKRHIDFILAAKEVKKIFPYARFFIFAVNHHTKRENQYLNHLHRTIEKVGLSKQIIFSEFHSDSLASIEKMDLIILPSINEGGSLAILEAMAAGKPVIATYSGANSEYVEDKVTGLLVSPKSPKKLAEAMIKILNSEKNLDQMGQAGRKRAEQLFDITHCVRKYEDLYETILCAVLPSIKF